MTSRVIAVAGHVDHGKTALVRALTGTETDTLAEEQRRGLTISLGFAVYASPNGAAHLIDMPGHADFVRAAVTGMMSADVLLLVVSAVDGVQPQTHEHLEIARLLGVQTVLAAITKSDLATPEQSGARQIEVRDLLSAHGFSNAPVFNCSSTSENGLTTARDALDALLAAPTERETATETFLPIDRVFTVEGAGTVVTGTLQGGSLEVGQALELQPSGGEVTVRGLQINGAATLSAKAGSRVAVNIKGAAAGRIKKGETLCAPGKYSPSRRFDVALDLARPIGAPLKHMETVTALHGANHASARLRLLPQAGDAQRVFAHLEFQSEQIAYAGQAVVLCRPASAETIAGGVILDPAGRRIGRDKAAHLAVLEAAASGDTERIAEALADRDGGRVAIDETTRLARRGAASLPAALAESFEADGQGALISNRYAARASSEILEHLAALHQDRLTRPYVPLSELGRRLRSYHPAVVNYALSRLKADGRTRTAQGQIALIEHDPIAALSDAQRAALTGLEEELQTARLKPPHYSHLTQTYPDGEDLAECLVWAGKALRLYNHALDQSILLDVAAPEAALATLRAAFPPPSEFTTSDARKALGTNRKVIVPLLEFFDREGHTRRDGNMRMIEQ